MEKRRCGRARCRGRQDGRFDEEQIDDLRERQTPHRIGMPVALVDGSVRQIAPGISPTTFWAAVTPAGGEVLGSADTGVPCYSPPVHSASSKVIDFINGRAEQLMR